MKEKIALALLSFFLGLGSFFSFYVAPTLFKVLERQQAGAVVEKVFPVYFGLGLILVGISVFLTKDSGKLFISLGVLNLLLLSIQEFVVIPKLHQLKSADYQLFLKYHGVSMGINLAILLLTLGKVLILIFKR